MRINNQWEIHSDYVTGITNQGDKFYIDIEDFEELKKHCWWTDKDGYISTQHHGVNIKIHQLLKSTDDKHLVDHRDRNKLNYRKNNLRIVSIEENCFNKSVSSRNKTGVIGVFWSERNHKWKSKIGYSKKHIHLGFYENIVDAICARLKAELKYFGECAPQKHLFSQYGIKDGDS